MALPNKKRFSIRLPSRSVWDFDLSGCPQEELEHCLLYEYGLECASVKKTVLAYRKNPRELNKSRDEIGDSIGNSWFGLPFRALVDYPEFPKKHWIDIDPTRRKQIIKELPVSSNTPWPKKPEKYSGPTSLHVTRLEAEKIKWEFISKEKDKLLCQYREAKAKHALQDWPNQLAQWLNDDEIKQWKSELTNLSEAKLDLVVNRLLKLCKKRIEESRRSKQELVVYLVDWNLRSDELKKTFSQWAKANRPHEPRPRSGGHQTKPVELLKALGAMRLLTFFQIHQRVLPRPYCKLTLHAGVSDFTIDERKAASRPVQPLYRTRKGWADAENTATQFLKSNFA